MDEAAALRRLRQLEIETPSWGYGNSGTRFHVYPWPGAARTVHERIADAALVHRLTGCCPTVALHIPWDAVDDYGELQRYAESEGVRIGAINPNLFGDAAYGLGSLCHPDERVRAQALGHCRQCIEIAEEVGSSIISLWLADGTNYPGQDDLRGRHRGSRAGWRSSMPCFRQGCVCSSSTSSSSRRSTAPTSRIGEPPLSCAVASAPRRRCSSTPAIIRRERTSSRSLPACSSKGC